MADTEIQTTLARLVGTVVHVLPTDMLKAAALVSASVTGTRPSNSYERYALDHVQIKRSGGRTDIVGADGIMLVRLVQDVSPLPLEDACDHTVLIPAKALLEAVKRAGKVRPKTDGQAVRIDVTGDVATLRPLRDVTQSPVETPVRYDGFPECDQVEANRTGDAITLDGARLAVLAEALHLVSGVDAVSETAKRPVTLWLPRNRAMGVRVEAAGEDGIAARATIMPLALKGPA